MARALIAEAREREQHAVELFQAGKNFTEMTYSMLIATSQGSVISAAKWVNVSPPAARASRFVRFETGSSNEAVLARWLHA